MLSGHKPERRGFAVADQVELYEALIARPGVYLADGGPIHITPERTARWEREFNRFKAAGYEIPIPWGHKLNGLPHNPEDPYWRDEELVRANSGYVEHVRRDKATGELFMLAQCPPGYRYDKKRKALVNEKESTVVRQVSPGFGDLVDGQGRLHRDVLFHVALCTHPVMPAQPGFNAAGTAPRRAAGGRRFMSAAGRIVRHQFLANPKGPPMAGENDKGKKKPDTPEDPPPAITDAEPVPPGDTETDPVEGTVITDGGTAPPAEEPPAPEPEVPVPAEPDAAGLNMGGFTPTEVEQLKQIMAQLGAPLLPDTSPANIKERLLVLLHQAASTGASLVPQAAGGAGPQPLDLSTEGAVPDQNATGAGMGGLGAATFMHHKTGAVLTIDPAKRVNVDAAAKTEADEIAAEWQKLAAKGPAALKAIVAEEIGQVLPRFHLSLNPETGQVVNRGGRSRLHFAKKLLAAGGLYQFTRALSRAGTIGNPAAAVTPAAPTPAPGAGPTDADLAAEVARLSGVPVENVVIRRGETVA